MKWDMIHCFTPSDEFRIAETDYRDWHIYFDSHREKWVAVKSEEWLWDTSRMVLLMVVDAIEVLRKEFHDDEH